MDKAQITDLRQRGTMEILKPLILLSPSQVEASTSSIAPPIGTIFRFNWQYFLSLGQFSDAIALNERSIGHFFNSIGKRFASIGHFSASIGEITSPTGYSLHSIGRSKRPLG